MAFQAAIETQLILERLLKNKGMYGIVILYAEIESIISCDVSNGPGMRYLFSARRMARRRYGLNFQLAPGTGVYLMDDEGTARRGTHYIRKIKNQTKLGRSELSCVTDYDSLTPDAKIRLNADRTIIGFVSVMTQEKAVKRLEETQGKLPNVTLEQAMTSFSE